MLTTDPNDGTYLQMIRMAMAHLSKNRRRYPDHKGEHWVPCPFHPEDDDNSFSFSERGFLCFACYARGSLRRLAQHLGLIDATGAEPVTWRPPRPKPKPKVQENIRAWQKDPDYWQRFVPISDVAREYAHSRGLTDATIERWRIGYGDLPLSRAKHPRLILPVFSEGRLVALRGRAIHPADQESKWLQSAGSKIVLFGAELLVPGVEDVVITEAPLSAIIYHQEYPHVAAVAGTGGASTWLPEWAEMIVRIKPKRVLVWYDNDLAGAPNPATYERLARQWRERYPVRCVPRPNAPKVVESLRAAIGEDDEKKIRISVYRWTDDAQPHEDTADVILRRVINKSKVA